MWGRYQAVNTDRTFDHVLHWLDHEGWLANFDRVAAGEPMGDRPGWVFSDSEVYKLTEAMAWECARTGDEALRVRLEALAVRVAAAQDPDGYLNTAFGHEGQAGRWSDLAEGHELYVAGHLLQAAVAHVRCLGDGTLVRTAVRVADQLCEEFADGARESICGHPEIEVGLAELGRALDEPRYLDMARTFLDRRGHGTLGEGSFGRAYFQDDVPVRSAEVLRGHAVRALYLSAAAIDVAVDRSDAELLAAVQRQYDRTVARRTYITGGMGSRHQDEGFGEDWELPNDRAYCETCAGIASIMVAWRLLLATGEVRYADLIERTLYNVVAVSPSDSGDAFFYANPLHQRVEGDPVDPTRANPRAESSDRAPWFEVSCCPTNLARTFSSLSAYFATTDERGVQLHQYGDYALRTPRPGGPLALRVHSDYPDGGSVVVVVEEAPEGPCELRLRVPEWCEGATLRVRDGVPEDVAPGWVTATGPWRPGDRVELRLPLRPRVIDPDPRIDSVRGCLAVEQGPDVLCLEGIDLPPGWSLDDVAVDDPSPGLREGLPVRVSLRPRPGPEGGRPYRPRSGGSSAPATAGEGGRRARRRAGRRAGSRAGRRAARHRRAAALPRLGQARAHHHAHLAPHDLRRRQDRRLHRRRSEPVLGKFSATACCRM
ncbi:glycoside hydrolase family 127 protein [Nocardioides sp. GY 10127]|nr:glycoside hydrolase family 127 protein [Nocardioides sp. GY 10127]